MGEAPEVWAFVLANTGLFVISSLLAVLCYLAYRRSQGTRSFGIATAGFGLIVAGGVVEPVYIFAVSTNESLDRTELFLMQGIEGTLLALGLGLLFYAVTQHGSSGPSEEEQYDLTDEDIAWSRGERSDD